MKKSQVDDIENLLRFDEINEFGDFDQKDKFESVDLDSPNGLEYMDSLLAQFKDSVNTHFMPDTEILDHLWDTFDASKELLRASRHEVLRAFSAQHLDPLSKSDIKEILGDPSIFVRFSATQRETVKNELWQQLSVDKSEIVRYGLALNPCTPQEMIETFVRDEHPLVRLATFRRGRLSAAHLISLANDPVPAVSTAIKQIDSDFVFLNLRQAELVSVFPLINDLEIISFLELALKEFNLNINDILSDVVKRMPRRRYLVDSQIILKKLPKEYLILHAGHPNSAVRNKVRESKFSRMKISEVEKLFTSKSTSEVSKALIAAATSNKEIWLEALKSISDDIKLGALCNWKFSFDADLSKFGLESLTNKNQELLDIRDFLIFKENEHKQQPRNNVQRMESRIARLQKSGDVLTGLFEEYLRIFSWQFRTNSSEKSTNQEHVADYVLDVSDYLGLELDLKREEIIARWFEFEDGQIPPTNSTDFWGGAPPYID